MVEWFRVLDFNAITRVKILLPNSVLKLQCIMSKH